MFYKVFSITVGKSTVLSQIRFVEICLPVLDGECMVHLLLNKLLKVYICIYTYQ